MTGMVRQVRDGQGSDIVRRLIARPIHMDLFRPVPETMDVSNSVGQDADSAEDIDDVRAELAIMKAALAAERKENADLRDRLRLLERPEPVAEEAGAVRGRWAILTNDLIRARA